jgi:tight adherence protein C
MDMKIALLVLVFVAVAATVIGVGTFVGAGRGLRQRLRGIDPTPAGGSVEPGAWRETVLKVARPVAKLATPENPEELTKLRVTLYNAGLRQPYVPVLFFAFKTALAVALPMLGVMLSRSSGVTFAGLVPYVLLFLLSAIGFYLPNIVLRMKVRSRQQEIFEAFPDAIDLIIVCIEAGLSLDMAINRAAREMVLRSPEMAEELELVGLELRIGATRERALRNLAMRTGVVEVGSFVAMMLQADRFGTSIADSLRVHAESLRVKRTNRAEEAAAKVPLKLLFPLIFMIFPALMLVLLGPAVIQIGRVLLPMMAGTR